MPHTRTINATPQKNDNSQNKTTTATIQTNPIIHKSKNATNKYNDKQKTRHQQTNNKE